MILGARAVISQPAFPPTPWVNRNRLRYSVIDFLDRYIDTARGESKNIQGTASCIAAGFLIYLVLNLG